MKLIDILRYWYSRLFLTVGRWCTRQGRLGTVFSKDKKYRYVLGRVWDNKRPVVTFIGLNPSTADETTNDNTSLRCEDFARRWGFGGLYIVNLFGFVSTERGMLSQVTDPVGPMNDKYLAIIAAQSDMVVAAWGNDGALNERAQKVRTNMPLLYCLDVNQTGEPKHPLYVSADTLPHLYAWKDNDA